MLNQKWVGILFDLFVRMIGVARFAKAGVQPLMVSAFVVAGGALHFVPTAGLAEADAYALDEPASEREIAEQGPLALPAAAPSHGPAAAVARLSAEQHNIARFIAEKYQLAQDQTVQFVDLAYRAAREVKVDPWLILAVVSVESRFDPAARSQQGAQGLMQVLTRVHADKFAPFGGAAAAFDPLANMRVGAQILKDSLTRDGSVEGALKAYVGAALMPHDGGYGAKVLTERDRIAAAAAGRSVDAVAPRAQPARAQPSAGAMTVAAVVEPRPVQPASQAGEIRFDPPVELRTHPPEGHHAAEPVTAAPRQTTDI